MSPPAARRVLGDRLPFPLALAGVALVALIARLVYDAVVDPPLAADATWYVLQAGTIAGGHGFVDPATFYSGHGAIATANFPPLWPTLLAGVGTVWSDTLDAYRFTGAVLGAGTVVLTGLLGRRILPDGAALAAAGVAAVSPLLIAADGALMAESLFTVFVTAAVLVAYIVIARPGVAAWVGLGALLGAAALTRTDALVVAPILVAVVAWRCRGRATGLRRVVGPLVALIVVVVVVVPWSVRSSRSLDGVVAVSTSGGSLLEGANCDETYGGSGLGSWDHRCLRFTRRAGLTEATWTSKAVRSATTYARGHLARLLAVVAPVRVLRGWGLWDPSAQAHVEAEESRRYGWQLAAWGFGLVLTVVGIAGAIALARRDVDVAPLVAVLVAVTVLFVVSWGNSRFRVIAEPALAVLAAGGVATRWGRVSARRG